MFLGALPIPDPDESEERVLEQGHVHHLLQGGQDPTRPCTHTLMNINNKIEL
jgi:hypothetical protein